MVRTLPEDHPFKMRTVSRRSGLAGEALRWYDRAEWLRGRTLDIPASERTAFQHDLDIIWRAVERGREGHLPAGDAERMERIWHSFFERWPGVFGEDPSTAPC
jgi:hypothetical protein